MKILKNIFYYMQGNLRYKLFYSKFAFLIPKYIREQIEFRINSMDKKCFDDGACKICGCSTTALQMANKACPKPCYPKMQIRKVWNQMKSNPSVFTIDGEDKWVVNNQKFYNIKHELGKNKNKLRNN